MESALSPGAVRDMILISDRSPYHKGLRKGDRYMKLGMVLEGGGMRGIYTAGVLDYFMDKDFYPDAIFGVSAGACHGASYASHQRGRSYRINLENCDNKDYMSLSSWLKTGDFFNADFAYHQIPDELIPFDYDTYNEYRHQMPLYAVVTNVDTGRAEYKNTGDMRKGINYVRASSSLPLMARIVGINGRRYLDGGISDSIPVAAAMEMGYERNILVLTRPEGYRKEPSKLVPEIRAIYGRRYPNLVKAMEQRHIVYNETMDLIDELEKEGRVFVIRPSAGMSISRLEKRPEKLDAMYELGYEDAKASFDALKYFAEHCWES